MQYRKIPSYIRYYLYRTLSYIKPALIAYTSKMYVPSLKIISSKQSKPNVPSKKSDTSQLSLKTVSHIGSFPPGYKYCGAIIGDNGLIYGIPNGATQVIEINPSTDSYSFFGSLPEKSFKWTNGCVYSDGCIYAFTRSSNTLLKINTQSKEVSEINLGLTYSDEHHYNGVLYKNTIYQPPRRNNTILCINLDDYSARELTICSPKIKLGYTGAIIHPNGLIYFIPDSIGKVMVFNPETERMTFIGGIIKTSAYNPVIAENGCIYGYGYGFGFGFLKIDPKINSVTVLYKNINFGSATTLIGKNGKLYNLVGYNDIIYEFDPIDESLKPITKITTESCVECKCAGGVVTNDGNIWCVPAFGSNIYKLIFE